MTVFGVALLAICTLVGVFIGVQDIAAVAVNEVGDGGDFAFAIGAGN